MGAWRNMGSATTQGRSARRRSGFESPRLLSVVVGLCRGRGIPPRPPLWSRVRSGYVYLKYARRLDQDPMAQTAAFIPSWAGQPVRIDLSVLIRITRSLKRDLERIEREEREFEAAKSSYYRFRSGDAAIAAKTRAFYGRDQFTGGVAHPGRAPAPKAPKREGAGSNPAAPK